MQFSRLNMDSKIYCSGKNSFWISHGDVNEKKGFYKMPWKYHCSFGCSSSTLFLRNENFSHPNCTLSRYKWRENVIESSRKSPIFLHVDFGLIFGSFEVLTCVGISNVILPPQIFCHQKSLRNGFRLFLEFLFAITLQ